ncbi:MAG TPA: cytochrome C peroxidase [Gammaproteobacteria bacterium]|nr:cytochrome C peroxidase [Gammaproteobacteria bacterium]
MMNIIRSNFYRSVLTLLIGGLALSAAGTVSAATPDTTNPCSAKNPCGMKKPAVTPPAANLCAAKPAMNPCGMKKPAMAAPAANPCAAKPAMNPCGMKKPAVNPCAARTTIDPKRVIRPAGTHLFSGNRANLEQLGEKLFKDPKLSGNGLSCNSCHNDSELYNSSFAKAYPHYVQMTNDKAGVTAVHADEMVQFCLVAPMESNPLPWDSRELAALTAYVEKVQKTYMRQTTAGSMMNPCAAKNPCGG